MLRWIECWDGWPESKDGLRNEPTSVSEYFAIIQIKENPLFYFWSDSKNKILVTDRVTSFLMIWRIVSIEIYSEWAFYSVDDLEYGSSRRKNGEPLLYVDIDFPWWRDSINSSCWYVSRKERPLLSAGVGSPLIAPLCGCFWGRRREISLMLFFSFLDSLLW